MSTKITILVEGDTEKAFFPKLREFLKSEFLKNQLPANVMPKLDHHPRNLR